MRSKSRLYTCAILLALLAGCGDEPGPKVPWSNKRTQVVGFNGEVATLSAASADDECVEYQGACLTPRTSCNEQAVDIVVDEDGKLLDYLCYPGEATLSVEELEARQGNVAQRENNAVILLDELDDGVDLAGDLSIDANNVVVYGEQADAAVISGGVTLDGNNALVRGVRIQGDVTIVKNNATLALCVIEGDLVIQGNNARVLACDVFGRIRVTGNNAALLGDRVGGGVSSEGKGLTCLEDVSFSDANMDLVLDPLEVGAAISCP